MSVTNYELMSAFTRPSLPCNPQPFLIGLQEGVKQNGTDWIATDEAKCILLTVLMQAYGQSFTISIIREWSRLHDRLPDL